MGSRVAPRGERFTQWGGKGTAHDTSDHRHRLGPRRGRCHQQVCARRRHLYHADQQCRNQLIAHGGAYNFDLTFHRTDIDLVEYSRGAMSLYSTGYWAVTGGATYQVFRDRYSGNQPFNINAADTITPYISTDGQLYIWYNTWSFSTQWDMSCTGNTLTKIIPNLGVVTLTFRNWWTIG
ncbi:MAG: hypothetical protein E6J91_40730 [Deltaproteobacteria bacterium]|nr:MAG: hypothetical protein E6J91_40730 [Deltaproteobacteria bacterium]